MSYEAWRISFQSSEQAARAAYAECARLRAENDEMKAREAYAYAVVFPDESRIELVHDLDELCEDMTNARHEVRALVLAHGLLPSENKTSPASGRPDQP